MAQWVNVFPVESDDLSPNSGTHRTHRTLIERENQIPLTSKLMPCCVYKHKISVIETKQNRLPTPLHTGLS